MQSSDPKAKRWILVDLLMSFGALAGLAISAYWGLSLRTEAFAASDLKTVYASAWCFSHRQDAYITPNLEDVFAANGLTTPPTWYGHAPVYPPPTLFLLAPVTWVPMVPALCICLTTSVVLLGLALAALLRYSHEEFGLRWASRALLVALFSAGPLLGFAVTMGNLSVPVSALCIATFVRRKRSSVWLCSAMLAVALLLKPHVAVWFAVAMLVLQEARSRGIALRAAGAAAVITLLSVMWMAATRTLVMQLGGYRWILDSEMSGGSSMSATSSEVLPVISQVTSVSSLLSFLVSNTRLVSSLSAAALLLFAAWAFRATRKANNERRASLAIGAWSALGLLATYHRAHDAIVLLVLLPWLISEISGRSRRWYAWASVLLYACMSIGPELTTLTGWLVNGRLATAEQFLLFRQAPIADFCLMCMLLICLSRRNEFIVGEQQGSTDRMGRTQTA